MIQPDSLSSISSSALRNGLGGADDPASVPIEQQIMGQLPSHLDYNMNRALSQRNSGDLATLCGQARNNSPTFRYYEQDQ